MFHHLARYYDAFVAGKDYRAESRRLEELARRFVRSGGKSWLDVGCGTGRHLEFLHRTYRVTGIDASSPMLRIARRRMPATRLLRADMRDFRLKESFDVVSCLFSVIAHLRTERELRATVANFARHLKPGGLVIIEPWIEPAEFQSGFIHLMSHRTPELAVVRMSSSSRHGRRSLVRCHYLIGRTGKGIEHYEEVDPGLLVPRRRLLSLMREVGLTARFVRRGLTPGRGLLLGRRQPR